MTEDEEYKILADFLTRTHHPEWHKPISLGSLTLPPFDRIVPTDKIGENAWDWKTYHQWYPPLAGQLKFFKENPDKVHALVQKLKEIEPRVEIYNQQGDKRQGHEMSELFRPSC